MSEWVWTFVTRILWGGRVVLGSARGRQPGGGRYYKSRNFNYRYPWTSISPHPNPFLPSPTLSHPHLTAQSLFILFNWPCATTRKYRVQRSRSAPSWTMKRILKTDFSCELAVEQDTCVEQSLCGDPATTNTDLRLSVSTSRYTIIEQWFTVKCAKL